MTAFKRKNDGNTANHATSRVFVGNNKNNNNVSTITDDDKENDIAWVASTMDRIQQLRSKWQANQPDFGALTSSNKNQYLDDPIALAIRSVELGDDEPEQDLVAQAAQVKTQLAHDIQQAKQLCDQESSVLVQLASQLAKFQEQRRALLHEIDDLDERQRASQKRIALYQEEASQELDVVNDLEEEKKRQVPRLKASISLYAVTTGIKWDFQDPDILSGQVVSVKQTLTDHFVMQDESTSKLTTTVSFVMQDIPSQKSFKLFSIDPRDYSPVETADILWDLMEGKTSS
jgi:hypothetical protein